MGLEHQDTFERSQAFLFIIPRVSKYEMNTGWLKTSSLSSYHPCGAEAWGQCPEEESLDALSFSSLSPHTSLSSLSLLWKGGWILNLSVQAFWRHQAISCIPGYKVFGNKDLILMPVRILESRIIAPTEVSETLKLRKYPKFPALLAFLSGLPFKSRIERNGRREVLEDEKG